MSLLKLKSKVEPTYNKNITANYENQKLKENKPKSVEKNITQSTLIIGEEANITGTIKEKNEISVQGTVDGEIECKDLRVGKSGNLKGKIKAETLHIEGTVEGEVIIKGLLKIKSSGSASGKMTYGSLHVDEGGKLIGESDFKDKNITQEEFKDWKNL
tara:strand:+ start:44 stop:517 length:474 start_codon:yes stop_codon:yes gene_type:complete